MIAAAGGGSDGSRARLAAMLEARTIAVVGASERSASFGLNLTTEVLRSPSAPTVHLVNPQRRKVLGYRCLPSLADVPAPVDLVLLGVPDDVVPDQLAIASARGDAGAVVFGTAAGRSADIVATAGDMALCGPGCMGFVNLSRGVRGIGYVERFPLSVGPIAMVTHSGSIFSALLRTHRRLEYSLAVSSGREVVTTTADYLDYALGLEETRVIALVLETLRDVPRLRDSLMAAADRDIPVVAMTVGGSPTGRALVDAHSGAIAGDDAAWEALFATCGVHRVDDLDEMADSLEAFAIGRRVRRGSKPSGVATLHDSGAERALVADVADRLGVPFAPLAEATRSALTKWLEPELSATNPLDVWSRVGDTEALVVNCLEALAADDGVGVVALAVDLVPEYDGDDSYPLAVVSLIDRTDKPIVVLTNVSSAVDQDAASRLRKLGVPVFEGTRSGLRAMGHLLADAEPRRRPQPHPVDQTRCARWMPRLGSDGADLDPIELVADYGISVASQHDVASADAAIAAAEGLGYPVALKTAAHGVRHKVDVDGVRLGLTDADAVRAAYEDIAARLGPDLTVQRHIESGAEFALGIVKDPLLGPLVVVAAGGTLVELLDQRAVGLPPIDADAASDMLAQLPVLRLVSGYRGRPPGDLAALAQAVAGMSQLAVELGDRIEAVDVNPVIVSPSGAIAVDALVIPTPPDG